MSALSDMVVGNRGLAEDVTGFQTVGRAARLVLVDGINDEIDRQQERWRSADALLEAYGLDVGVSAAGLDHVDPRNVFQGPHKSLAQSPLDRFPNVSVTAYAVRPAPGNDQADRYDLVEVGLLVEVMVVSGAIVGGDDLFAESVAHQRAERTAEAALVVIRASRNLMGSVLGVTQPRGGLMNQSWTRDSGGGKGPKYVLHGSRFQYALPCPMTINRS